MADRTLAVSLRQGRPMPLDIAFTCAPGQVLALFGPSGSGKSTILRSIAGLYRPEHANVRCGDTVWADTDAGVFRPPWQRPVGLVFQEYALFPHLTALDNVVTALGHRPRAERRRRARQLLEQVHLSESIDRRPAALSGGERQRVALARALAREPAVLLLDEPFAAVDRAIRRRLQDEVDQLRRAVDIPLILVTHDFDDVVRLASDVLILERGCSVAAGPLAAVTSRSDLAWLREAIGLGTLFEAVVTQAHRSRRLVELAFDGGILFASDPDLPVGTRLRVRIPARDVILATSRPEHVSLHNVLSGTVAHIHTGDRFDHVIVQLAVGRVLLLAEVTSDAIQTLNVVVGMPLHALVKSVSIDVIRSTA